MIGKLSGLMMFGPLGWLVVALLGFWLILVIRRRRAGPTPTSSEALPAEEAGPDIFEDLRQRYAKGEISPEEYPEELVRVPGAIDLYDPFAGSSRTHRRES